MVEPPRLGESLRDMRVLSITLAVLVGQVCLTGFLPGQQAEISLEMDETVIVVERGAKPMLQYNRQPTADAARFEPHFTRTGYIHPLHAPSGRVVSGDYSPDHVHQHGLFFAWTKSSFRGQPTEFWNQVREQGDVRFHRFLGERRGADGGLEFRVEHFFTSGKDSDEAILREEWAIDVPGEQTDGFHFDLTSTQVCATDDPLVVEQHRYGGMAIRGNPQWLPQEEGAEPVGGFLTSEGKTREDGNHSRPRWVAMYGPVDGAICGVALLGHPDNFRAPQWVRLHPAMPYFVFGPMVEEPFRIEPGTPYVSRFRVVTFDGEPDAAWLDRLWEDFAG